MTCQRDHGFRSVLVMADGKRILSRQAGNELICSLNLGFLLVDLSERLTRLAASEHFERN